MQPSQEIKSRLDIIEVLREYINLQPGGSGFRALCPFHREKSPSFMVSQEKQIWHCFGCGEGGDVLSFVQKMEGLSFTDTLRLLAPRAGVELRSHNPQEASKRNRILDALAISANYYHQVLTQSNTALAARNYLVKRGLKDNIIENWLIGYSPESWDDLVNLLKKKGFGEADIFASGLSVKQDRGSGYYNRFRGRIMFPIRDINGNVVGFTARVSPEKEAEEKMGKYINSPQTEVYDKSKILFGLDKAKQSIRQNDLAIVVEGQMDVISAHQNGFYNVVASSGTALTSDQVAILKRYSNNLALAFDMDAAGQMAAERGIGEAMQAELNIKVIEVPEGKDPDECIRNNPGAWENAVKKAVSAMEYFFGQNLAGLDLAKIEDKRKAAQRLLPKIAKLNNKIEQSFWLKKLSQTIDIEENIIRETLGQILAKQKKYPEKNYSDKKESKLNPAKISLSREERSAKIFLALLLKYPFLMKLALAKLPEEYLSDQLSASLYSALLMYYTENQEIADYSHLRESLSCKLSPKLLAFLDEIALLGEAEFSQFDENRAQNEALDLIFFLKNNFISKERKQLEKMIKAAELKGDETKIDELMKRLKSLN